MRHPVFHLALGIFLCLAPIIAEAQEHYGRIGSNYSPTTSLWFNPALASDSRVFVDIHLAGFSLFANNTYAYIPGDQMRISTMTSGEVVPAFNRKRNRHHAYVDARMHGPSITAQIGKWNVGVTSALRSTTSVRGAPNSVIEMARNGLQHPDNFGVNHQIDRMRIHAAAWMEVGLNVAGIIKQSGRDLHSVGIHARRLFPITGASVVLDGWQFQIQDSMTIATETIDGNYAFHNPESMSNGSGLGDFRSGKGWGFDFGWSWKRAKSGTDAYVPFDKRGGCKWCEYEWKLSVALIDVGVLSFDPPFYTGEFEPVQPSDWQDYSNWNPETAEEAATGLTDELGATDPGNEKFRMLLPAAATIQYDYHLWGGFYLDAAAVVPVPWMKAKAMQRDGSLGITPRWERKRLEVALPFTLTSLRRPNVGLMLRLNSIIIGSDNLFPLVFKTDAYGADFYFHLKYSIFRKPGCKPQKGGSRSTGKGRSRSKGSSRGHQPCPDW